MRTSLFASAGRGGAAISATALLLLSRPVSPQTAAEVFVLATLYHRHATIAAYSHDTLRQVIQRINPDVLVLDVSPRELRARAVAPSKAEYPEVIFPLLRTHGYPAYAGEPDEPTFTEIVSQLGSDLKRFRSDHPAQAQADQAFNDAAYAALGQLWQSPAAVNSTVTDEVLQARRLYQDKLAGPGVASAWRRWNDHALSVVQRAARDHPAKRILVLIGVENCGPLRAALRNDAAVRLVDMERWLRDS